MGIARVMLIKQFMIGIQSRTQNMLISFIKADNRTVNLFHSFRMIIPFRP